MLQAAQLYPAKHADPSGRLPAILPNVQGMQKPVPKQRMQPPCQVKRHMVFVINVFPEQFRAFGTRMSSQQRRSHAENRAARRKYQRCSIARIGRLGRPPAPHRLRADIEDFSAPLPHIAPVYGRQRQYDCRRVDR